MNPANLVRGVLHLFSLLGLALLASLLASPAAAQSTYTFTSSTTSNINSTTTCAAPIVRTFNVATSFTVSDVDLGAYATHTWRGDIQITLQSPDGTRVQLVNGDINTISGDNFNVRLDDAATQVVNTDSATAAHSTTAPPPFAKTFRPNSPLSAFNGKSSVGNWRVEVCDLYPSADNGILRYVALYLTAAPNTIDLSLLKSVSTATPAPGTTVSYTLTVNSASTSAQTTGVTVKDLLPAGVTYVSYSGSGTYVPATGIWTLTGLAPGQSRSITIVAIVAANTGTTVNNTAEITSADYADIDSTPNNGVTTEDDYATVSFTATNARTAGTPPVLTCSAGKMTFDWTGRSWPAGSTTNNYTLTGFGAFNWSLANPATWTNDASVGGQQPTLTTATQGILSLSEGVDFTNTGQVATTTITLGAIVDGAQFTLLDVDYYANQFADRVRVYGRRGTTTITPVLTNGAANYIVGNEAFGDASSPAASANGNVVVTFNQPIDQIVIEYGNHALAPADPMVQAMQLAGGISICKPVADLVVTKTSTVLSDPVRGTAAGAMAIPGAMLRYCIAIHNNGSATASSVAATDVLPASVAFQPGTIRSGTTCTGATTVEDDDASDGSETDVISASYAAAQVNIGASTIASSETVAVTFEALVQ